MRDGLASENEVMGLRGRSRSSISAFRDRCVLRTVRPKVCKLMDRRRSHFQHVSSPWFWKPTSWG